MRGVGKSARIEVFLDPNVHGGADDGRAWQPQVVALADESRSSPGTGGV